MNLHLAFALVAAAGLIVGVVVGFFLGKDPS